MMKLTTKFLMAGAVAAVAIAMSAAPSDAAKRRAAATKNCANTGLYCSMNCANGWCNVYVCGADGKYAPAVFTPVCMQGMCANIHKKC